MAASVDCVALLILFGVYFKDNFIFKMIAYKS